MWASNISTESREHHFCYCKRKLVFALRTAIMTAEFTWFLNFVELALNILKCPVYPLELGNKEHRKDGTGGT